MLTKTTLISAALGGLPAPTLHGSDEGGRVRDVGAHGQRSPA